MHEKEKKKHYGLRQQHHNQKDIKAKQFFIMDVLFFTFLETSLLLTNCLGDDLFTSIIITLKCSCYTWNF